MIGVRCQYLVFPLTSEITSNSVFSFLFPYQKRCFSLMGLTLGLMGLTLTDYFLIDPPPRTTCTVVSNVICSRIFFVTAAVSDARISPLS